MKNQSIFHKIIILLPFLFVVLSSSAQAPINTEGLKDFQLKRFAQNAIRKGDTYSAITYYEAFLKNNSNAYNEWYEIANLYRKARDYQNSEKAYKIIIDNALLKFPDAQFYYARMLKANGNYEAAKTEYTKFTTSKNNADIENIKQLKKLAKAEIVGCDTAIELSKGKYSAIVTHLNESINKAHVELSPLLLDSNTLVYASLNEENLELYDLEKKDSIPVRKFYVAKKEDKQWNGGKLFKGPFNEKNVNVGNGALSPDGNRFYFSKCKPNFEGKIICRLYVSTKEKNGWSEPKDLGDAVNSDEFTSTMPTVGIDTKKNQEIIYFVSNRTQSSKGGLDIWYTTYDAKKKVYKDPKNLGGTINTVGDEMTPNYDIENKTLYFSSDGFAGLGELDIFQSIGEVKNWSVPENIGAPFNSSADDIYYIKSKKANEKSGFFVSNRKGGVSLMNETCCDDIYEYSDPQYLSIFIAGKIIEVTSDSLEKFVAPVVKAPVSLFKVNKDSTESLLKTTLTNEKGEYSFQVEQGKNYKVLAESQGFLNKKVEVSTETVTKSDTIKTIIGIKPTPKGAIVISNIYYETAKADLRPDSRASLDKELVDLLKDNPKLIIEISSHTDDVGTNEYNQKLSQARAESVVNYLIGHGIDKSRLIAKGYGEGKPIAPNTTPEGRQKNRRTEFKIIGYIKNVEVSYDE
jgi:outer membrane protein OmpA-like peptidoglycan-associated protein/tetratricopeptide (TPR) repeat protein